MVHNDAQMHLQLAQQIRKLLILKQLFRFVSREGDIVLVEQVTDGCACRSGLIIALGLYLGKNLAYSAELSLTET